METNYQKSRDACFTINENLHIEDLPKNLLTQCQQSQKSLESKH
jgi:hypothetical protein